MREILFRGKRTDNGEWVEGLILKLTDDEYGECVAIIPINCESYRFVISGNYVLPSSVGQYTGLEDKNGNKIFEGDIVKGNYDSKPFVVSWHDESCGFEPYSDSIENCGHCGGGYRPEYTEVIGNIYDNPELPVRKIKDIGGWVEWAIEEAE